MHQGILYERLTSELYEKRTELVIHEADGTDLYPSVVDTEWSLMYFVQKEGIYFHIHWKNYSHPQMYMLRIAKD